MHLARALIHLALQEDELEMTNLLEKWSEMVSLDIVNQIKDWDSNIERENAPSPYKFTSGTNSTLTMDIDSTE